MTSLEDLRREDVPPSFHVAKLLDFLWMASLGFRLKNIPMWTGWNSLFVTDLMPMQKICYLPQLNISPTSNSAVLETLKMSKRLAKECNQKYFSVTYDLAISKMALTIQAEEKPEYDCLFIHPGSFHIELFLFKAI